MVIIKKERRALILIPCCDDKTLHPCYSCEPALKGVLPLRDDLLLKIKNTLLADRLQNQRGLLCPGASVTNALSLYSGTFYKAVGFTDIVLQPEILIVSAAYGLVKATEGIKIYDLQMKDRIEGHITIAQYWQKSVLSEILREYIAEKQVTIVWSLLPDSHEYQYHQVFKDFWMQPSSVQCYHVKVYNKLGKSVGNGIGRQRANWLRCKMETGSINQYIPDNCGSEVIDKFEFRYGSC